jgi:hypothetical protein
MGLRKPHMGIARCCCKGVEERLEMHGFPLLREFLRIPSKFLRRCAIWINER